MHKSRRINKDQISLQMMVIPGILLLVLFKFVPIYGLQLAFKDLVPSLGIWNSPTVGWKHFIDFFTSPDFNKIMSNTLIISFMKIAIGFPIPIIFALMLWEIKSKKIRSIILSISFLPHFLSWVVSSGIWISLLSKDNGVINDVLMSLRLINEPIHFLGEEHLFRWILVFTETWKDLGWNALVYMAAIYAIDDAIYEAAEVDGIKRFQKMFYITLPCIMPTIIVMFILRVGYILDAGFEQILVFRNPMVYDVSSIIDTYVYDTGMKYGRFGYATAVGLFKSIFAFTFVWLTNKLANKKEMGIW